MNFIKKNTIALSPILILVIGIFCSYYNLGILSIFFSVFLPLIFIINIFFGIYGFIKKKYFYLTGVFLFIISFSFFYRISISDSLKQTDTVSLLSFNVREFNSDNDINQKNIAPRIFKFIDSIKPDILILQETDLKKSQKIKGYKYHFLGFRNGVKKTINQIFSNYPIVNTGYIDFPNTLNNGMFADIKINTDTIRLYNLHLQSFGVELNSSKQNEKKVFWCFCQT